MLTVVAAIIESRGKLLACQRKRGTSFEMMWEFPGGKTKSGETLEQALARELHEELDVEATIGPEIYRTVHKYDELREPIELVFFAAKADPAMIRNRVFEQIQWHAPQTLPGLEFLPADRELVERLASGAFDKTVFDAPTSEA